jgi:hypothetical protein
MHNHTPEDLIRYLYKETSQQENVEIEDSLCTDWTLREKFAVLKTSFERLNTIIQSPRTESVLNILKYATGQNVVKA